MRRVSLILVGVVLVAAMTWCVANQARASVPEPGRELSPAGGTVGTLDLPTCAVLYQTGARVPKPGSGEGNDKIFDQSTGECGDGTGTCNE